MIIDGVEVNVKGIEMDETEIRRYIEHTHAETSEQLTALDISQTGEGKIALDYTLQPPKFERIRRITGYLVGTTDRWNNAKRAEERDRVKHVLAGKADG